MGYSEMERKQQVLIMANIICDLCGKPKTCKDCSRQSWCGTIPAANKLWEAGYREEGQRCDKDGLTAVMG